MSIKEYNKLIRDKIPEIIKRNGAKLYCHRADDAEYLNKLIEKLLEESEELATVETVEQQKNELADVLEVIIALTAALDISQEELEAIRQKKYRERGGFAEKLILEKIEEK